jgi:hypothetical protein
MDPLTGSVTTGDQVAGLNYMADQLEGTPQMGLTLFQADSLLKVDSKLDPNLTAALISYVLDEVGSEGLAEAIENGFVDYFNADGTPTEELQNVLNGDGIGAWGMLDNLPDEAKPALENPDTATPEAREGI